MAEVNTYVILVDNSIAKFGRYLKKGEEIELEERFAHTEFAGRVALASDPKKQPTETWLESQAGQDEFQRELAKAGLRAHERVQLLTARKTMLAKQLEVVDKSLAAAQADFDADAKKAQERPVRPAPQPESTPSAPPATGGK